MSLAAKKILSIKPELAYRLFYPQVPMIICSRHNEEVAGMTANSAMSVSDSPPMVALAVNEKSRTQRVIKNSRMFSVNWLSYDESTSRKAVFELSRPFKGTKEQSDKLRACRIPYSLIKRTPVLKRAEAFGICEVASSRKTGDHILFIAKVIQAEATSDFIRDGYWEFKKYEPMLYLGSNRSEPLTTLR